MALSVIGNIGDFSVHYVDPLSTFNIPRVIVKDVSTVQMAGGIRIWMGNRAPLSIVRTVTWTSKGATAIGLINQAAGYVGFVKAATLATAASAIDSFAFEITDVKINDKFSIPDGDTSLDTMLMIDWEVYLVRTS